MVLVCLSVPTLGVCLLWVPQDTRLLRVCLCVLCVVLWVSLLGVCLCVTACLRTHGLRRVRLRCGAGAPVIVLPVYLCQRRSVDKRGCLCLHVLTVCCAPVTVVWRVGWPCCAPVIFAGGCVGKELGPSATEGPWGPLALGPGCLFLQVSASALRLMSVTQMFCGHGSQTHSWALHSPYVTGRSRPTMEGAAVRSLSQPGASGHGCLDGVFLRPHLSSLVVGSVTRPWVQSSKDQRLLVYP